ncbi:MAG: PorT family protein [Cyclobacteriaceae bacterium]|nr:PorT family protein [Cyclobacteriaceae bacterium]MDH4296049.1 PorT family protein [Cyclobacteriaceae bacterium]MDH5249817.1 PorT family protein [Cyclobacteriaceae bacterium]
MKRTLIILCLLAWSSVGYSQILISLLLGDKLNSDKLEFGLDGGISFVDLRGISEAKANGTFNLGFYFDLNLKNPAWMVHTGVIVKSTMGAKHLDVYPLNNPDLDAAFSGGTIERRLSYFDVPILIKHRFKNKFTIEAGPMVGLLTKSFDVFTQKVKDKDDLTYKLNVKDAYHPLDAGLMIGLGYRLMGGRGMNLGIRYYYGLVDIMIDDTAPNVYNRALYLAFGIPIGGVKTAPNE